MPSFRHYPVREQTTDGFEKAARIVEGYAQGEDDVRVIELLADIARDIRAHLIDD